MAEDLRLNEQVALKFLPPEIAGDAAALDELRRETRKSRQLTHQHIVRIHDLFEAEGEAPFISMEYVEGPNLSELRVRAEGGVLTWEFLEPLVRQLCDALNYAHGEGVIHRDLKPGNVMLDSRGRVKLADFGIAAQAADSASRVSLKNLSSGTVTHMSPQQMNGELPQVTDDIYSLGATLYELLSGNPPFYSGDIVQHVREKEATPLEERQAELGVENPVPSEVSGMIMACLFKEAKHRPQSASDALAWLGYPSVNSVKSLVDYEIGSDESGVASSGGKGKLIAIAAAAVVALILFYISGVGSGGDSRERREVAEAPPAAIEETPVAVEAPSVPGTLDENFRTELGANARIYTLARAADGKILVGGEFTAFAGKGRHRLARLHPDGTLDDSFRPEAILNHEIWAIIPLPDGKTLVGGKFANGDPEVINAVVRLNPDGTRDRTFQPKLNFKSSVIAIAPQANGKIFFTGRFSSVGSNRARRIARLRPDGSFDATFRPQSGADGVVREGILTADGDFMFVGAFKGVNGQPRGRVALVHGGAGPGPDSEPRNEIADGGAQ
ncbi:MAG: putative delta-60 repeat protein [Limisphaerales bacterium]